MTGDWLILDTSGRVGQVGLARNGVVVRTARLDAARRHARDLALTVATLLGAEALKPDQLTGVVVSRGPGSFTGLRVGLISAKTLAYATGCRLVAVDTFAAIARQVPPEADTVWVLADALRGQVYRQCYRRVGGEMTATDALRIEPFDHWAATTTGDYWVTGPGATIFADRLPPGCRLTDEADREPRIASLFAVGQQTPCLTREELFALEPLYLRGSSAEEKARPQGGSTTD